MLAAATVLISSVLAACGDAGREVEILTIPGGSSMSGAADSLAAHGIIDWPLAFRLYGRLTGVDRSIKAGVYRLPRKLGWSDAIEALVAGRTLPDALDVAPGSTIARLAPYIAAIAGTSIAFAERRLFDPALADSLDVPGPSVEGYIVPSTYRLPPGTSVESIAAALVEPYARLWTPERRAMLASLALTEREVITLASIIQAETRRSDEMPLVSTVYHNRLRLGMRLQADPTVQYLLPPGTRLRSEHIEALGGSAYNTYAYDGLPPGPIGSPSEEAIDAALRPTPLPYLYFAGAADGRLRFSTTFEEHRRIIEGGGAAATDLDEL
jgi:UPF0755 protein